MTQRQYDLVKVFLDALKVKPERLCREWGIEKADMFRVQLSLNYEQYSSQRPDEDIDLMNSLFGGARL